MPLYLASLMATSFSCDAMWGSSGRLGRGASVASAGTGAGMEGDSPDETPLMAPRPRPSCDVSPSTSGDAKAAELPADGRIAVNRVLLAGIRSSSS